MAVVIVYVTAAALTLTAVLWDASSPGGPVLDLLHLALLWITPPALCVCTVVVFRARIRRWLVAQLEALSGPGIVRALPPRVVLTALFERVYGVTHRHEEVVVGVLGGAGNDVRGRDIAASRRTAATFQLRAVDDSTYSVTSTWTHRLSGGLDSYKFIVFATCDPETWNLIPTERRLPLYESWFVTDEDLLEDFVPNLQQSLKVGIDYTDRIGNEHHVPLGQLMCKETRFRDYDEYVRLPDDIDRKNLRILEFDLGELIHLEHAVEKLDAISVRATALASLSGGLLTWSPLYPCFVETITFDVVELAPAGTSLMYKVIPFTMRAPGQTSDSWGTAEDVRHVVLDSWLLPGHGVALFWTPGRFDLEA